MKPAEDHKNKPEAEKTEYINPIQNLSDEVLDQVAGGSGSGQPGLTCPGCGGFIPVSMEAMNTAASITCPNCGSTYNLNHQESQPAIDALKKFQK